MENCVDCAEGASGTIATKRFVAQSLAMAFRTDGGEAGEFGKMVGHRVTYRSIPAVKADLEIFPQTGGNF